MITVYEERGEVRGVLRGKRDTLLRLLRRKFGDLPESVAAKVQAIQTEAELDRLSERILDAGSLEEMGLAGAG